MTITYRAALAGDSGGTSSTTQAVTLPAGWQAGDFCVIGGRAGNSSGTFTTPSGWTVINAATYATGGYAYCFYYRVLQAGDGNPVLTYSVSSTWCWDSAGVYSSTGGTLSFDAQGAAVAQNGTAGSTFTPPAAAAAGSGECSLIIAVGRNSAVVTPTGWTDTPAAGWTTGADDAAILNQGGNTRMAASYYQLGVSGTVTPGTFTFTLTGVTTTLWFTSQQVLVQEAGSTPKSAADTASGASAASVHATLGVADSASGAEAGSAAPAGHSGADTVLATESAFYVHSGADAAQPAAEGAQVRVRAADSVPAADRALTAWPASHDAARAAEKAWWSGPLASADTGHAAESVRPFPFSSADAGHAADALHETGIWTYIPVGVRLLVPAPYRHDRAHARRLDAAVMRLAGQDGWVRVTRLVRSGDEAHSAESAAIGKGRLRAGLWQGGTWCV